VCVCVFVCVCVWWWWWRFLGAVFDAHTRWV
jgi:hypothetical protein